MKKIFGLLNKVINTLTITESSQVNDDKMKLQEQIEQYKEVYEYTQKELDSLVERKRHIEMKILYLLQACALIITLFTALLGQIVSGDFRHIKVSNCLVVFFYIAIAISVIFLVTSLNDSLASWKFTKFLLKNIHKKDMDKELIGVYREGDTIGLHLEIPTSKSLLDVNVNEIGKKGFYQKTINALSKSIRTSNMISLCKNMYFNLALKAFVISIILVIALGILVA